MLNDKINKSGRYPILHSELITTALASMVALANRICFLVAQFRCWLLIAFRVNPAALLQRVVIIISVCSKEAMRRVYASSIVAFVKDIKLCRYGADVNNPRSAMGFDVMLWPSRSYFAIAAFFNSSRPHPALAKFRAMWLNRAVLVHLRPKPLREVFRKPLRLQVLGGNRWLHSVSRLIVCHALGCLNSAREQLCLGSQFRWVFTMKIQSLKA